MVSSCSCPHVNTTVQDVLGFICWKMSDYPSYCLDHLPCDFQCAVVAATPQGVLCWEQILADVWMKFLPEDLWGLFLNSLLCHKKIPKYVSLEHTSCIYNFQCNSIDKFSKILITKELSLSFHSDRTHWSLLRQTAASDELKNSMFQRPTSSPSLGWCGNRITLMMEMESVSKTLDFIIHWCSCLAKKTLLTTELSSNVIITTDSFWQFYSHCQVLLFMSVRVTFIPLYKTWTFMVVKIYTVNPPPLQI